MNHAVDNISSTVPGDIIKMMEYVSQSGYTAWLVGGCVRDMARQQCPDDFDMTTDARPDDIIRLFPHHALTGYEHGTITVFWHKRKIEITTLRTEADYSDSRRPGQVAFHGDLESDLARRDFTINSMAWRPDQGLIDLFGGLEDLGQKRLRCVGDPASRFSEDALRMLRAVRFSMVLGFEPESDLLHAAASHSNLISRLSRERIWTELKRLAVGAYHEVISMYSGTGVVRQALYSVLGKKADDGRLCFYLGRYSGPALRQEQIVPFYIIILGMASGYAGGAPVQHDTCNLEMCLKDYSHEPYRRQVRQQLISESRLSRTEASLTTAVLYWMHLVFGLMKHMQRDAAVQNGGRHRHDLIKQDTSQKLVSSLVLLCRETRKSKEALLLFAQQTLSLFSRFLSLHASDDKGTESRLLENAAYINQMLDQVRISQIPLSFADLAVSGEDLISIGLSQGPEIQQALNTMLAHAIDFPEDNQRFKLINWYKNLMDI